jgi:excisionase family DNA binding protein
MPSRGKVVPNSFALKTDDFNPYVRLLKKDELAQIIGKSRRSVELMMLQRQIPYLKLGRHVRFRLGDVEKALENFAVKEVKR